MEVLTEIAFVIHMGKNVISILNIFNGSENRSPFSEINQSHRGFVCCVCLGFRYSEICFSYPGVKKKDLELLKESECPTKKAGGERRPVHPAGSFLNLHNLMTRFYHNKEYCLLNR